MSNRLLDEPGSLMARLRNDPATMTRLLLWAAFVGLVATTITILLFVTFPGFDSMGAHSWAFVVLFVSTSYLRIAAVCFAGAVVIGVIRRLQPAVAADVRELRAALQARTRRG